MVAAASRRPFHAPPRLLLLLSLAAPAEPAASFGGTPARPLPVAAAPPPRAAAILSERAASSIEAQISSAPLVVFALPGCPYCDELHDELTRAAIPHELRLLSREEHDELREATNQRTVPYVFGRGRFVGGCHDGPEPWMGALPLLRSGALQTLVESGELPEGKAAALPQVRRRHLPLALASPAAAAGLYFYQRANPRNPIELLRALERKGPSLPEALGAGRGTVVEFYAPWCISCRELAPFMYQLEKRYEGRVSFVLVDGSDPSNAELVRLFGVDGVPHFGFIDRERKLVNTLVGEAPRSLIEASLKDIL
ncbi:hypothetical protein AB1Y20_001774 [Prymnesium parvum]|uniref:Thioredoxin domain-containing protein n=1 Tax=Prymnesium parvum TaxID=97485 RepID=A0AB34KDF7_PRYPA